MRAEDLCLFAVLRVKQIGTFETIGGDLEFPNWRHDGGASPQILTGQRRCPNRSCLAHLFVVLAGRNVEVSYPAERIDFDSTNVPAPIVASLEEAITCHANRCFIAAAIMVRKTLELLCSAHNATGSNLKERVKALGSKVVLPAELLDGLDDVRLLGNDAAHFESKDFANVSQEEVDVAIELTKEVLKAQYQYSNLLARMRALKK
jgi:Domain of unknown function (DUF4145)